MERYERKAEIEVLRLNVCDFVSDDVVARLREVVVDVSWDGIVHEFADKNKDYDIDGNSIYSDDSGYDYGDFP